jgi:hypothetical protein
MKPIFIYKYEKNMQKKSREFFELFNKQGDEIEQNYVKEQLAHNVAENRSRDNESNGNFDKNSKIAKQFTTTKDKFLRMDSNKADSQGPAETP